MIRYLLLLGLLILPTHRAAAAQPVNLQFVNMESPSSGWALAGGAVLHTDGGPGLWRSVTPPGVPGAGSLPALAFVADWVDQDDAWIAVDNGHGSHPPRSIFLYHTLDAGRHWTALPALHISAFYYVGSIHFVDDRFGWMMVILDVGMSHVYFDLYHTADGGHSWARVRHVDPATGTGNPAGLPGCDCYHGFAYLSPTTGWATGCTCDLGTLRTFFFVTHDAGRHWSVQPLPGARHGEEIATDTPVFFDSRHGVLPVYLLSGAGSAATFSAYTTSDAGRTWTPGPLLRVSNPFGQHAFSASGIGYYLDGRRLYRLQGGAWVSDSRALSTADTSGLQAVGPTTLFALRFPSANSDASILLRSTDGGRTWHVIPTERD